jgi:hypothetical protein
MSYRRTVAVATAIGATIPFVSYVVPALVAPGMPWRQAARLVEISMIFCPTTFWFSIPGIGLWTAAFWASVFNALLYAILASMTWAGANMHKALYLLPACIVGGYWFAVTRMFGWF